MSTFLTKRLSVFSAVFCVVSILNIDNLLGQQTCQTTFECAQKAVEAAANAEAAVVVLRQQVDALKSEILHIRQYGGAYETVDDGAPQDNAIANPLTGTFGCPAGTRPARVARFRTAEPSASAGVGATQFACINDIPPGP